MQCFHCHYPDSRVVSTWIDNKHNSIKRSRKCLNCDRHFSTEEKMRAQTGKSMHEASSSR